jgi:hypothetical protein
MPSPFDGDPAASAATNVPCPSRSATSAERPTTSYVAGALAARSGAVTSAPVSTTAIVIAFAARSTRPRTRFSLVATNCHS